MRQMLLTLATLLPACTMQPQTVGHARADDLTGRVAGKAQSCVSIPPTENIRHLDSATLAYRSGRVVYVNRLRSVCPHLTATTTLLFDLHAGQYCSGDHFRTVDTGSSIPGPACVLGDWEPFTRR